MFLEIDDKPVKITMEDLQRDFPNLVGKNPYRAYCFKYLNIIPDKDNPGKDLVAFDYIPNTFTGTYKNARCKFRYYRTKVEKGPGKEPVYTPDTWCFDRTGQLIIDLSENAPENGKDIALVYFHLKCPQYGQVFYLVNIEHESSARLEKRALKTRAVSIITDTSNSGYLDLTQCIRLAKKLQIANAEALEEFQLRDILSTFAESKPEQVMSLVNSEEGRIIELLQSALDHKVIYYNHADRGYYYTMRPDTAKPYAKVTVGSPFYIVTPNFYADPLVGLEKFVTLQESVLKVVSDCLRDEQSYLGLVPTKGNQKVIHLAKQISVEIGED